MCLNHLVGSAAELADFRPGCQSDDSHSHQPPVLSTAWQETCWRQFVQKAGKVSPIISYNQSSVGLMQINVRVWRGIYRPEGLLWNAPYNMQAGCEILDLYFLKVDKLFWEKYTWVKADQFDKLSVCLGGK
jgi:hypothetical protein